MCDEAFIEALHRLKDKPNWGCLYMSGYITLHNQTGQHWIQLDPYNGADTAELSIAQAQ